MYLIVPHSTPHRGHLAIPHGAFVGKFTEQTEKDEAALELTSRTTGAVLTRLVGRDAEEAWDSIEAMSVSGMAEVLTIGRDEREPEPNGASS